MLSKVDLKFFKKSKQVSEISDYKKQHVGCVAVYQGHIIGVGCNCEKTHPIQKEYNNQYRFKSDNLLPKLHAEMNCINQIKHLDIVFSKVKLYVFRSMRNGKPFGMSRPCPSCMAAIKDLGIREIYYTTNDGYAYEKLS